MGPIGCIAGLIAQIVHMAIMIIALPVVLICKIFEKKD